jgi:Tfp pilus assembly protein PilO
MFEILAGVLVGMGVCAFGMWCYIKGETNGMYVRNEQLPQNIQNPVQAAVNTVQNAKDKQKQSDYMAEAVQALGKQMMGGE